MEVGSREQALRIQVCMQPGHWSAVFLPGRFERSRPVGRERVVCLKDYLCSSSCILKSSQAGILHGNPFLCQLTIGGMLTDIL
jgi:hypothetical protein